MKRMERSMVCVCVCAYVIMWHLSTCLKFCMLFIFSFLGYVMFSLSSHFVLYLYCNKLMCVHMSRMSRMSFERLFSVSLFSLSFSLRDACVCMCVVALVQIKLYMPYIYIWLWFGCISICLIVVIFFFFLCSHLATATHWILIRYTGCESAIVWLSPWILFTKESKVMLVIGVWRRTSGTGDTHAHASELTSKASERERERGGAKRQFINCLYVIYSINYPLPLVIFHSNDRTTATAVTATKAVTLIIWLGNAIQIDSFKLEFAQSVINII